MHPHERHHQAPGRGAEGLSSLFGMARQLQGLVGQGRPGRAPRGDVRAGILRLLAEAPMHGHQIIGELAERSGGAWTPSAGSVYPTLQLLADEGLVESEPVDGKKVYRLTAAGTDAAAHLARRPAPWDDAAEGPPGGTGFQQAAGRLAQAVFQVGRSGSAHQLSEAVDVLNDARRRLYAILAAD